MILVPSLKPFLQKNSETASFVRSFLNRFGNDVSIHDTSGNVLWGVEMEAGTNGEPIRYDDHVLGQVYGPDASMIATMLSLMAQKEAERKRLGQEVLNSYQELNVIFNFAEKLAQSIEPELVSRHALDEAQHSIPSDSGVVVLWEESTSSLRIQAAFGMTLFDTEALADNAMLLLQTGISGNSAILHELEPLATSGLIKPDVRSLIYAALKVKQKIMGAIILASCEPDKYTAANLKLLVTLAVQSSTAIENALLYERNLREVREREEAILKIHEATMKFVPSAFIRALGKEVITDVKLGDQIEKEVTVLFTDIRNFTTLSEQMTPAENFSFVSAFNERMGPIIRAHNGFVNQYLGDSIMAIFPDQPEDALAASIAMIQALDTYNNELAAKALPQIRVGIGMHTGSLIMGITGDKDRMDAATISDTVNTAARIEGLSKHFRSALLVSEKTIEKIPNRDKYLLRYLGKVQLKGKQQAEGIFECFSGDTPEAKAHKTGSMAAFNEGMDNYIRGNMQEAIQHFSAVADTNPTDQTARYFVQHAQRLLSSGLPVHWNGILEMTGK